MKAVNDDLNTSEALSVLWEVLDEDLDSKLKLELIYDFDRVLGLGLKELKEEKLVLSKEVKDMLKERENARKEKNWSRSDEIRIELSNRGFVVEDTSDGQVLRKK